MAGRSKRDLTPADCLRKLPEPTLDATTGVPGEDLRHVELRSSMLKIAQLDHVNETILVRRVATKVRGEVPHIDE